MKAPTNRHIPTPAFWLTAAGAVPFVAATAYGFLGPIEANMALLVLLGYGAVVLSFMGGIHWGLAMGHGETIWNRLALGILPALVAWSALLLSGSEALIVLAVAFGCLLVSDLILTRVGRAPLWYPRLRVPVTVVAVACLLLAHAWPATP